MWRLLNSYMHKKFYLILLPTFIPESTELLKFRIEGYLLVILLKVIEWKTEVEMKQKVKKLFLGFTTNQPFSLIFSIQSK